MSEKKVSLTKDGFNNITRELEILKGEKRRKISRDIAEARAHGDISENAEYDAAKEAQGMNEKKIAELEDTLSRAQIIDEANVPKDTALLGATVTVEDKSTGDQFDYMLVAEEESDFDANKISGSSPVGKALMGHKKGDIIEVQVPVGTLKYEIIKISR